MLPSKGNPRNRGCDPVQVRDMFPLTSLMRHLLLPELPLVSLRADYMFIFYEAYLRTARAMAVLSNLCSRGCNPCNTVCTPWRCGVLSPQSPMLPFKAIAAWIILIILVTLDTFQPPMFWLKSFALSNI